MLYCQTEAYKKAYPYAVEYIDEHGFKCSDTWSASTLANELREGVVLILKVEHRILWDSED